MKIHIYSNGARFVSDGSAHIRPHGQIATHIIDLGDVTEEEKKKIFINPHDDQLISSIQNRKKALR